ncbi:MAG: FAD-dependent oxidoreductase [Thermoleophilia bacterium]|nr:FAD-dependent oxidoreductase [Thermoleophilia bacterium]
MGRLEADVIVVAGGAAGLSAAVAAAQQGASVVVFEKGSTTGGTGNMGMGPFGVESRLQRLKQMGPTKDEAFRMLMDYTHWRVDARLVRAYIDKAATTIDWLEGLGVEFLEPATYFPGGQYTWHIVKPETGEVGPTASATLMKILTERAKEMGARILLQTPVRKLVKQGERVTGVVAEDRAGEPVEAQAGAVVVATGGFGDNPEMIKRYTGYDWGKDIFSFRIPGMEGDGIRMAWEVGAAPTEMTMEIIYGMRNGDVNPELHETFRQPHLMVNLLGQRFMNEGILCNTTFAGNAIAAQKDRTAFLIFDGGIKHHMETAGFDIIHSVFPFMKVHDLDGLIAQSKEQGNQDVFVAGSLEELAEQTGIDPGGLAATVEEYNRFCACGHDDLFNKDHKLLRSVTTPPFYAARHLPGAYGSLGGIKINHRTEVLDRRWEKIPGLYAAGTDACTIYGDSYVFILPGNTMGFALNTGRIAGENAAEHARTLRQQPATGREVGMIGGSEKTMS